MSHSTIAILGTALWCAGCQSDPEIRVTGLDLVAHGESADEYSIQLELYNPSEMPLVLDLWEYNVKTDGGSWTNEWVASRTLPARSITQDSLPVVLRHGSTPITVTTWQVDGSLRYLLPGQLAETLFDLGVSRPSVGFAASGHATPVGPEATAVEAR